MIKSYIFLKRSIFFFRDYDCLDFHSHCPDIVNEDPDACNADHPSYDFMRVACMATCQRCKNSGCRDEFIECEDWAKKGYCFQEGEFMAYHCRESCGTCGIRSSMNQQYNYCFKIAALPFYRFSEIIPNGQWIGLF